MQPKYCLPIIKPLKTDVLETIRSNAEYYSYFEVWLDYVEGLDETFILQLDELLGDRLILLFRRQNFEPIQMGLQQRFDILAPLDGSQLLVDLDVGTQAAELDYIREHDLTIKTIVSYHNYKETPAPLQIEKIIGTMEEYHPTIYKLATLCNSQQDALGLLQLLLNLKTAGKRAIVIGMGEIGSVSRVLGALWGNEMTFAPQLEAEQSAPGQLTRGQFEAIFKELKG